MPLRARCAATMVPENPPPTIATGRCRSDVIVRPLLRVLRPHAPLLDVVAEVDNLPACRFGEPARYNRVNQACTPYSQQLEADLGRSGAMLSPRHPERSWMVREEVSALRFVLFYS